MEAARKATRDYDKAHPEKRLERGKRWYYLAKVKKMKRRQRVIDLSLQHLGSST